ncbi:MAG TPA: hypothetical protein VGN80_19870 [Devosiaceae bacterium]|jgi:hypothetical protein|nr:hypothetical protein [Devosiaceae bacterium]
MTPTYYLARDHLEQAVCILHGTDAQTQQLRYIVERTIALMTEIEERDRREQGNVLYFERYQRQREGI